MEFNISFQERNQFEIAFAETQEMRVEFQEFVPRPIPSNYGLITWDGNVLTVS